MASSQVKGLIHNILSLLQRDIAEETKKGTKSENPAAVKLETAGVLLSLVSDDVVFRYARDWTEPYIKRIEKKDASIFVEAGNVLNTVAFASVEDQRDVIELIATVWKSLKPTTKNSVLTRLQIVGRIIRPNQTRTM